MDLRLNILSLFGVYIICFLAWIFSNNRERIPYETIKWGLGIQFLLAFTLIIFPAVHALFGKGFGFFVVSYSLFPHEKEGGNEFFSFLFRDPILLRGISVTITLSIIFRIISQSNIYQKILNKISNFFRGTFQISSGEGIFTFFSSFLSYEAIFLIPRSPNLRTSDIFTLIAVLISTPSGFIILSQNTILQSVSQNFRYHIYLASLFSAISALVISKILVPVEGKSPEDETVEFETGQQKIQSVLKFTLGLLLGGTCFWVILMFWEGVSGSLIFGGDLRIVPEDSWSTVVTKVMKSGFTEIFTRITPKTILAFFLLPVCFFTGISFDLLELWKVALVYSQSILSQPYESGIPILIKEGALSNRSLILTVYLLSANSSLVKLGMGLGGVLALFPGKISVTFSYVFRLFLVCILSPFLSLSVVGIFELGHISI